MNDINNPYNECTFITTHNSFSNKPDGWKWYQQTLSVQEQLDKGVRGFMIDLWLTTIKGVEDIYLLHNGFELTWLFPDFQFKTLKNFLDEIQSFLDKPGNENEIVTVFFDSSKSAKSSGNMKVRAIMKNYLSSLFDPSIGKGFNSTLKEIIDGKKRLIVFSDNRGTNDVHSLNAKDQFGLPAVWHYCRENCYGEESLNPTTWNNLRPESADSRSGNISMNIVNHFPTWSLGAYFIEDNYESFPDFLKRYFDTTNGNLMIRNHVLSYYSYYKQLPNFIAVDQVNFGEGPFTIGEFCNEVRKKSGTKVRIKGLNDNYMVLPNNKVEANAWIYCQVNGKDIQFEILGSFQSCALKLVQKDATETLYLNYRDLTGAVKLYNEPASFKLENVGNNTYRIYSYDEKQYMWLQGDEPYITGNGESVVGANYWFLEIDGIAPYIEEIEIKSTSSPNEHYLTSSNGLTDNALIYCKYNVPLIFQMIGPNDNCLLRLKGSLLYLNFRNITGAVKLYSGFSDANFKLTEISSGVYSIYSHIRKQYMWLSDQEPYFTATGDPTQSNARWGIAKPNERSKKFKVVKIKSAKNNEYMRIAHVGNLSHIVCAEDHTYYPQLLEVIEIPNPLPMYVIPNYLYYLGTQYSTGGLVLTYSSGRDFAPFQEKSSHFSFRSDGQFMWLNNSSPYLDSSGDGTKVNAQWIIEEVKFL